MQKLFYSIILFWLGIGSLVAQQLPPPLLPFSPPPLLITLDCPGGCADLAVPAEDMQTLAGMGYEDVCYTWLHDNSHDTSQPNICPAETTTYEVVGTSNGDIVYERSFTIETPTPINFNITATSQEISDGQEVMLSVEDNFVSYLWSNGSSSQSITITTPSVYSVTVTNEDGCEATEEIEILIDLLQIYNGLFDWQTNTDYSGGNTPLSDTDEEMKGAVTVANKNDTDGDGIEDKDDNNVLASLVGRNEIDLMRLDIRKPPNASGGSVVLTIESGNVKLWESSTKGTPIAVSSGSVSFPVSTLDKTIYVEALEPSGSLQDIVIKATYQGNEDVVKATAVWVNKGRVFKERGNNNDGIFVPDGLPNNPVPYIDFQLGSAIILGQLIETRKSTIDNSRYGFGSYSETFGEDDCNFGGRILLEFIPFPNQLQLNDLGIHFDIGRKRKSKVVYMYPGISNLAVTETPFPTQVEMSNDDWDESTGNNDEDRLVENGSHEFYSYDAPSIALVLCDQPSYSYVYYESNFFEYARISFDDFTGNTDAVLGSRCSSEVPWNVQFALKEDVQEGLASGNKFLPDNHKMTLVTSQVSHSFPKMREGNGNGVIDIDLHPNASTSGYTLQFYDNVWYLYQSINNDLDLLAQSASLSNNWEISVPNQLIIYITNSVATTFTSGTILDFNVFRTENLVNDLNCD